MPRAVGECAKVVFQVLLITSLTLYWLDLLAQGWEGCGDNNGGAAGETRSKSAPSTSAGAQEVGKE